MAQPKLIDQFVLGDVALLVYECEDESKRWWLQAGVAMIEFNETTMPQLVELMRAFIEEGEL